MNEIRSYPFRSHFLGVCTGNTGDVKANAYQSTLSCGHPVQDRSFRGVTNRIHTGTNTVSFAHSLSVYAVYNYLGTVGYCTVEVDRSRTTATLSPSVVFSSTELSAPTVFTVPQ